MTLFDVDDYLAREPVVGVIPVCHRCGARGEPIPSDAGGISIKGWWPGVAFALIALAEHESECPSLMEDPLPPDENRHLLAP